MGVVRRRSAGARAVFGSRINADLAYHVSKMFDRRGGD